MSWSAGTIYGPGTLTVASGATLHRRRNLDVPSSKRRLVVDGTFNVAATNNYYGLAFMGEELRVERLDHRTLRWRPSTWPWTTPPTP